MKAFGYVLLVCAALLGVSLLLALHSAYSVPHSCQPPCDGGAMLVVASAFIFVAVDLPLALAGAWLV